MIDLQPQNIDQIKDLLSTMGDIKAGSRAFYKKMGRPDPCAACELADIDWHKVRELLGREVVRLCQEARQKERDRITKNHLSTVTKKHDKNYTK